MKFIRNSNVPVLGINTGRLGFLANISKHNLEEAMDLVHQKKYVFQKRSMIRVETEDNIFGNENIALNEMTQKPIIINKFVHFFIIRILYLVI